MASRRRQIGLLALALVVALGLFAVGRTLIRTPIALSAHLTGRELVVTGETDQPDGRQVDCAVTQWDEYFKALNRGQDPGGDPHFRYRLHETVNVNARSFSATFPLDGWPAGQAGVSASYPLGPTEGPPFGLGVTQDSDGIRYVEVSQDFGLP